MPYKHLFSVIFLLVPAITIGAKEKKSFNKSVFSAYSALPANKAAMAKTQKEATNIFGDWMVVTDKLNGMFTDVFGDAKPVTGNDITDKANHCISEKLGALGVMNNEWILIKSIVAPKADYVNYYQVIANHAVVMSKLSFRFTKSGKLARIQMKNYGTRRTGTGPSINKQDALNAVLGDISGVTVANAHIEDDWSWFPVPIAGGYELHPAWQFRIDGKIPGSTPLKLNGYIDGITGEILYRTNDVKETGLDLTVRGTVYKYGTLNPATAEPLVDLNVLPGSSSYYTDTNGNYSNPLLLLPISTTIPLAGKWSTVIDSPTNTNPIFTVSVTTPYTYIYPVTAPSSSRHVNAYYHTTRIHNFMKRYFPAFTLLDFSLRTVVDDPGGTCDAYFTGNTINFYAAGGGCNSFAEMGDVVYHEYGHAINTYCYYDICGNAMGNSALQEAYADVWALSVTHDPVLAKNAFITNGGFIRRYDITPQVYPIDYDPNVSGMADPHRNGQIIAGAWWDLGINIGSEDSMTQLFTDVFYDYPDGPDGTEGAIYQSILIDALMADDNDANLSNGTPHYAQIVAAFAKHGIYLEGDVYLGHTELNNQPSDTAIPVSASLSITSTSFMHDMTLYYRANNAGAWMPVTLTNSGVSYDGTIPAQPAGTTIEYYFVIHDNLNTPNAYFPITCNSLMPAVQTTIPYQFGVGIIAVDSMNFETVATGYSIGGNAGDDAVANIWAQTYPSGGYLTSDHTTGVGQCLVSDNFVSNTGMYGTSTVLSPIFDISSFAKPVIEYYRWFSNEGSLENFKSDPWIVKLRDATGNTWQTIEETYQADDQWRRRIFSVKAYLPSATQVQLKFFASDSVLNTWPDDGQNGLEEGVDDLYIYDKGQTNNLSALSPVTAKAQIYPDPADDRISLILPAGTVGSASLWDVAGRKMSEISFDKQATSYTINTKYLPAGQYNLSVNTGSIIEVKKMVVVHQ